MEKKRDVIKLNKIILIGVMFTFLLVFLAGNIFSAQTDDFGLKISSVSLNVDGNLDVSIERNDDIKAKEVKCVNIFTKDKLDKSNLDTFMSIILHDKSKSYKLEDIFYNNSVINFTPAESAQKIKIPDGNYEYFYMYCVSYLSDDRADWMGSDDRVDWMGGLLTKKPLTNALNKVLTSEDSEKYFRGSYLVRHNLYRTERYIFLEPNLETSSYFLTLPPKEIVEDPADNGAVGDPGKNITNLRISDTITDLTMFPESLFVKNVPSQDYICVDHICYINKKGSSTVDINISFQVKNVTSKDIYVTSSLKDNSSFSNSSIFSKPDNSPSSDTFNFSIEDNLSFCANIKEKNTISFVGNLDENIYLVTIADYNKGGSPNVADFSGLKIDSSNQITFQKLTKDNFLQDPNYELDYYYLVPVEKDNYSKLLLYLSNKKILNFFCEDCLPDWLFYEKDVVRLDEIIVVDDMIVDKGAATDEQSDVIVVIDSGEQITDGSPPNVRLIINYLQFLIDQLNIFDLDEIHDTTNGYGKDYDKNTYTQILWDLIPKKYNDFCYLDTNYEPLFKVGKQFKFTAEEMAQFWAIVTQESSFGTQTISQKGNKKSIGFAQINMDVWCSESARVRGYNQLKNFFPKTIVNSQDDYNKLCKNIESNKDKDKDQTYSLQFGAAVYSHYKNQIIGKNKKDFPRNAFSIYDDKDAIDAMFAIGYKYNSPDKGFFIHKVYTLEKGTNLSEMNNKYLPVTTTFQTVVKLANYLVYKKILFDIWDYEGNTLEESSLDSCVVNKIKNKYSIFNSSYPTIPFINIQIRISSSENSSQNNNPNSSSIQNSNKIGLKILSNAEKLLGKPYVSEGRMANYAKPGVDCIGLQYVALKDSGLLNNKAGFDKDGVPSNVNAKKVFSWGATILEYVADEKFVIEYSSDLDYLQPGDFIYFKDYYHAGIYKGYNSQTKTHEFIQANITNSSGNAVNKVFIDNIEAKLKINNSITKKLSSPIYVGRITTTDFGSINKLAKFVNLNGDDDWGDNDSSKLYNLKNNVYFNNSDKGIVFQDQDILLKGCVLETLGNLDPSKVVTSENIQRMSLTIKDIRALNILDCSKVSAKYQNYNSLKGLENFKNLRILDVSGSKIESDDIIDIISLTELRELNLSNTKINATSGTAGLEYLHANDYFPNLKKLTIDNSFRNSQIIESIKNMHPGIEIVFN